MFKNIRLAGKLLLGFGAVLMVVALSSAFTLFELWHVADVERLNAAASTAADEMDQSWGSLAKAQAAVGRYALTGASDDKSKIESAVTDFHQHLAEARKVLMTARPEFVALVDDYGAKVEAYLTEVVQAEARLASDPATRPKAVEMISATGTASLVAAVEQAQTAFETSVDPWAASLADVADATMTQIIWMVVGASVASILVGGLMAWLITRAVGRPLKAMTETMGRLAEGDNSVTIPAQGQTDEIGRMAATVQVFRDAALAKHRLEAEATQARRIAEDMRAANEAEAAEVARKQAEVVEAVSSGLEHLADGNLAFRLEQPLAPDYEKLRADFNKAMTTLQDAIRVVSANTAAIRSGTAEISSASDDLSRRTEQQAASLEETAAALDEITATVKKTAEGAVHARAMVSTAKTDAERSGTVVNRAVAAMTGIESSSQKISQIIGVIDEIAFQTNLLALNAGVEAARAGEAGRGFAVVASEVRALAQRSAEAAKEIKGLISASAQQVGEGVDLVGEAGRALERIMVQVADINGIVADIAASAQEQSTGLDQVNTAINQMDQVTQQNAAMVEQSTAAGKNLAGEADELARLVGRFKVGDTAGSPRGPVRTANRAARPVSRQGNLAVARKPEPVGESADWEEF